VYHATLTSTRLPINCIETVNASDEANEIEGVCEQTPEQPNVTIAYIAQDAVTEFAKLPP
jgi:hypothetical protein